ncbi:MAG TPA: HlyD family efflux transporter periplasmic adaptor subunit [Opitutaceae bacterium]|nr:HlyD family efflux transporter periplasmic adaptor subunit [Opitutaceae bacterium]
MDIQRPSQAKAKLRKRIYTVSAVAAALVGITVVLARLKPAVPTVDRSLVWVEPVKRGPMVRQVHGPGTLVPVDIRWIAARTQGRVERIVLLPGATVEPDSVILVLSNPDVTQAAVDTESQLKAGEAELSNLRVTVQRDVLQSESEAATAKAQYEQARLQAQVNDELLKDGLVSELVWRLSKVNAEQAQTLNSIAQKRFSFAQDSVVPQLAVKQAEVDRLRDQARLKMAEADALNVRAGMRGILQVVPVEVGAQVQPGANLARVADPSRLKAEVQIAETQAKDVLIGQSAEIDTRNGVVSGKVSRIDPSVQNGTVKVDVAFSVALPLGARPDLSVDGVIELEHLNDVIYVGRPAFGQEHSTANIFRLDADGVYANRVQVQLGRSSVNTIEIVKGLEPGDRVILSDMSQWDAHDRIRLN